MSESSTSPEIPVWVGGSEKWVTGVGKRTTCDDVIYALLCHVKKHRRDEEPDIRNYGMYEGWMGVERPLQGRTRILKVWKAWGENSNAVTFTVRKHKPFTKPHDGHLASAAAVEKVRRRRSHRARDREEHAARSSRNKRSTTEETLKKARKAISDKTSSKAKLFHEFVTRVLEQERKIQEQVSRISRIQSEIEHYERIVSQLSAANAKEPVSDNYLQDLDQTLVSLPEREFDDFANLCDSILYMEDSLCNHRTTVDNLTSQLHEESLLLPKQPSDRHPSSSQNAHQSDYRVQHEIANLNNQLEHSISLSLKQQDQLKRGTDMVSECDLDLQHKLKCMARMEEELNMREHDLLEQLQLPSSGDDLGSGGNNSDVDSLCIREESSGSSNAFGGSSLVDGSDVVGVRLGDDVTGSQYLAASGGAEAEYVNIASTSLRSGGPVSGDTESHSDAMFIDAGYLSQSTTAGEPSPDTSPADRAPSANLWQSDSSCGSTSTTNSSNGAKIPQHRKVPHQNSNGGVVKHKLPYHHQHHIPHRTFVSRVSDGVGGDRVATDRTTTGATTSNGLDYDSNSDTGLSSLHSSDECTTVLETLV